MNCRVMKVELPEGDPLSRWMNGKWAVVVDKQIRAWFVESVDADLYVSALAILPAAYEARQ